MSPVHPVELTQLESKALFVHGFATAEVPVAGMDEALTAAFLSGLRKLQDTSHRYFTAEPMSREHGEWRAFHAGETITCPFGRLSLDPRGDIHTRCGRTLGEVGQGIGVSVRVHPDGKLGRPGPCTTTRCCPRCSTLLEFAEERRIDYESLDGDGDRAMTSEPRHRVSG